MESAFPEESAAMIILKKLGFYRLAWALRRLYCPVSKDALVLEVGSGGNPFPRSNVLMDAYQSSEQRHGEALVMDRPFVFGVMENMPFRTKSFSFLISCHVLEHSLNPCKALLEFQRVANAGYIETPDIFMERINPYMDHRMELFVDRGILKIQFKPSWIVDKELVGYYERKAKHIITRKVIPQYPFDFMVRYFWKDVIPHEILNPTVRIDWPSPADREPVKAGGMSFIDKTIFLFLRKIFSQNERNQNIDLLNLLRCPTCHFEEDTLIKRDDVIQCPKCGESYPIQNGVPVMFSNL